MKKITSLAPLLEKILFVVLLGLAVGLVLLQANPLMNLPSRDGGIYAYIGNTILEGKPLYIYAWDSRPPGIFYLDALALWLGRGSRWGIWLVEYLFLFIAAWIGYRLMRRLWQPGAAIFGTGIWLLALNRVLSGGNFTEEYPLLFDFLALWLFWLSLKKPENLIYDFLIGLTLAFSFLFRANNVGVQVSILLTWVVILLVARKFKLLLTKMAALGIGALVILVVVCMYFWARGALQPMFDAAILYNFSYSGGHTNIGSNLIAGYKSLGRIVWIALVGYLFAFIFLVRSIMAKSVDAWALLLIIGWPIEIIFSSISGRNYGHYFISWMPMMALLSGMNFSSLEPLVLSLKLIGFINKRTLYVFAILLILLVGFSWDGLAVYQYTFAHIAFDRASGIEINPPIVKYLRQNTKPGDTVLVWGGQTSINFMAHRDAPTAYIFYPLYVDSPFLDQLDNGFYQDITTRPPFLIVDAYYNAMDELPSLDAKIRAEQFADNKAQTFHPPHLNQVYEFIQQNYALVTTIDNYPIYQLNRP